MRLFIGIPVPDEIRSQLMDAWKTANAPMGNCRQMDPSIWHFTLAFLGDVGEDNIPALESLLPSAVKHPPQGAFRFTDFRTFPSRRASYLVANAIADPPNEWIAYIERLRDVVSVVAMDVDRKPWVPHVTIARAKKNRILAPWSHPFDPFEWRPNELTLVHSLQTANGSIYTHLHAYPFNV